MSLYWVTNSSNLIIYVFNLILSRMLIVKNKFDEKTIRSLNLKPRGGPDPPDPLRRHCRTLTQYDVIVEQINFYNEYSGTLWRWVVFVVHKKKYGYVMENATHVTFVSQLFGISHDTNNGGKQ